MRKFEKPIICVSKCLGFEPCRYNGQMSKEKFVEKLKDEVKFIKVCPETAIGLTTPRPSLRIVKHKSDDKVSLMQPDTNIDFVNDMDNFSKNFLENIGPIDGFILKGRSPSCGIKDVKIYSGIERGSNCSKGTGIFANRVLQKFKNIPVEDEGRLTNYKIREYFLIRIYINAKFRIIQHINSKEELLKFHNENKMLIMTFNQSEYKKMNKIIKEMNEFEVKDLIYIYGEHLKLSFLRNARYTSKIKILNKAITFFSRYITLEEKEFIFNTIDKYKQGKLPFSTCLYIVKSYAIRFGISDITEQSFFNPYPEYLIEVRDSGKGVN